MVHVAPLRHWMSLTVTTWALTVQIVPAPSHSASQKFEHVRAHAQPGSHAHGLDVLHIVCRQSHPVSHAQVLIEHSCGKPQVASQAPQWSGFETTLVSQPVLDMLSQSSQPASHETSSHVPVEHDSLAFV